MGTFRGTTAIQTAVDEVWHLRRPTDRELNDNNGINDFRVALIEKSRNGREEAKLRLTQHADNSYTVADHTDPIIEANGGRISIGNRILMYLRELGKEDIPEESKALSVQEMVDCPRINVANNFTYDTIKKSVQRLKRQDLIEQAFTKPSDKPRGKGAKPHDVPYYKAILAINPNNGTFDATGQEGSP
jgi:hypothetical protein